MKVLSLLQPWASLVVMGTKTLETRSWTTAYRGPLLIHASKGRAGRPFAALPPFAQYIRDFDALPFGCIIGEVQLRDVIRVELLDLSGDELRRFTLEEKAFGDYSAGRYAWVLEEAQVWDEVIPATGKLGVWEF